MKFISYAQNFEDVMLWRALKNIENGFYIDIGANDHLSDSVTKAFYDHGWSGINIEPLAHHIENLKSHRVRDINLQFAVGNRKSQIEIYKITADGLSTIDPEIAAFHQRNGFASSKEEATMVTLSSICEKYVKKRDIHFLKIDVEGSEHDVLLGSDFYRFRPWIIVIESTLPNSQIQNFEKWEHILISSNYYCIYSDGLNRFYLAEEQKELEQHFRFPPNVFDDFIRFRDSKLTLEDLRMLLARTNVKFRTRKFFHKG